MNAKSNTEIFEDFLEDKEEILEDLETDLIRKFKFLNSNNMCHIKTSEVEGWLNNFRKTNVHRFFALLVLDSITYRNDEMLKKAVLRTLIKNIKPVYEEKFQSSYLMLDWVEKLKTKDALQLRYYGVNKDTIMQSSGALLRTLTEIIHQNSVIDNDEKFIDSLNDNFLVIIIDDMLGSGDQFKEFLEKMARNPKGFKFENVIYCPLMARDKGLEFLEHQPIYQAYPVKIIPCEILTNDNKLFNSVIIEKYIELFNLDKCSIHLNFKNLFKKMNDDFSLSLWIGYKQALLAVIFEWGCPNQTTSMIYNDTTYTSTNINSNNYQYLTLRRK